MTKLSDTQLIVLSSAAKHDERLATRPANLNATAGTKVASSLIDKGLAARDPCKTRRAGLARERRRPLRAEDH